MFLDLLCKHVRLTCGFNKLMMMMMMMMCALWPGVGGRLQVPVQLYAEGDVQVRRQSGRRRLRLLQDVRATAGRSVQLPRQVRLRERPLL